jgi:hypothetical protein
MSATDLEISNLRREIEKLRYVQMEILEEMQKFNAFLEGQQQADKEAMERIMKELLEDEC